jgi:hypothetical protein
MNHDNSLAWPLIPGSDAVLPMVCCNKIATRISDDGALELPKCVHYVLAVAILIRQGVARIVETTVDATAHMSCQFQNKTSAPVLSSIPGNSHRSHTL